MFRRLGNSRTVVLNVRRRSGGGSFEETGMVKIVAQRSSLCDFGVAGAVADEQTGGRGAGPGPG